MRYSQGPVKGLTVEQATSHARDLWAKSSDGIKEKYARMEDNLLAPSERLIPGLEQPGIGGTAAPEDGESRYKNDPQFSTEAINARSAADPQVSSSASPAQPLNPSATIGAGRGSPLSVDRARSVIQGLERPVPQSSSSGAAATARTGPQGSRESNLDYLTRIQAERDEKQKREQADAQAKAARQSDYAGRLQKENAFRASMGKAPLPVPATPASSDRENVGVTPRAGSPLTVPFERDGAGVVSSANTSAATAQPSAVPNRSQAIATGAVVNGPRINKLTGRAFGYVPPEVAAATEAAATAAPSSNGYAGPRTSYLPGTGMVPVAEAVPEAPMTYGDYDSVRSSLDSLDPASPEASSARGRMRTFEEQARGREVQEMKSKREAGLRPRAQRIPIVRPTAADRYSQRAYKAP